MKPQRAYSKRTRLFQRIGTVRVLPVGGVKHPKRYGAASLLLALACAGCRGETPSEAAPGEPRAAPSQSVSPLASATASGAPETSGSPDPARPDPENRLKPPLTSDDLAARATHLLDAVARGEPSLADDFFFPRAPFLPLKDVADPGHYFDQLLATYHRDIAAIHQRRKSWEGVSFVSFELGSPPGWVAPGKEYNKIGYYRTFHGKLRYTVGGAPGVIDVTTIISWGGRWYITHLAAISHPPHE
jgi:hypothetical protein